jgi:hypothetical protein
VPVESVTLLTTLVDYHKPGDIEVFLDENSIKWLEKSMAEKGYLDGKEMASAFRLLRSNSLVWHYVVRGYLFGEAPPPFDVLFWNMDSTRMPAAMHSWYLRNFYLENLLIRKDALTPGRREDRPRADYPAAVCGIGRGRSHRTLAADFPHQQLCRRAAPICLVDLGSYPRHRESGGESAQARLPGRRRGAARYAGRLARAGGTASRQLVGRLDGLAQAAVGQARGGASRRHETVSATGGRARHLRA